MNLTDWVKVYDDALDSGTCMMLRSLVDSRGQRFNEDWRRCDMANTEGTPAHPVMLAEITKLLRRYQKDMGNDSLHLVGKIEAPNVFRYRADAEGGPHRFHKHTDAWSVESATRLVSVIYYLNDVGAGGETVFYELDLKVEPRRGRAVVFPSSFLFEHEGRAPVSNDKYVLVTWLHVKGSGHHYRVFDLKES